MQTITDYMSGEHRSCDNLFAEAETAAAKKDLASAKAGFEAFHKEMLHHLAKEENILFPAFEKATGSNMGPTRVMLMEHEQMRGLFAQMQAALDANDSDKYAGLSETLLILMQQHNFKEEQMLYPMADRALQEQDNLIERMQAL